LFTAFVGAHDTWILLASSLLFSSCKNTAGFTFLGLVVMVFLVNPTYEETCDEVNKTKGKRFMATQNQARASQRRSSAFYVPTLEINELVSDTDYDEDNSSGGEGKTSAKVFVEA